MPSRPLIGPPPHIRRRRARFAMAVVLLLAITIGAIGWWLGSGRYTEIPSLVGKEQAAAIDLLQQAGLDPGRIQERFSEDVDEGMVISANPGEGEAIRGTDVRLVVSMGAERFVVPADLAGQAEQAVVSELQETLPVLQVTTEEQYDDEVARGFVLGFDPPAGTELKRDQVVTVFVSAGRAPVAVPDVVGLTDQAAVENLKNLGFVVKRTDDGRSADVEIGEVMSLHPTPGGPQPYGSTVTIRVSEGLPIVEVPDVTGKTGDEAKRELEALGLTVEMQAFFGSEDVIRQRPAAGETVEHGTTVSLLLVG